MWQTFILDYILFTLYLETFMLTDQPNCIFASFYQRFIFRHAGNCCLRFLNEKKKKPSFSTRQAKSIKCISTQFFWLVLDFIHVRMKQLVEKCKVQMVFILFSCIRLVVRHSHDLGRTMTTIKGHRNSSTKTVHDPFKCTEYMTLDTWRSRFIWKQ